MNDNSNILFLTLGFILIPTNVYAQSIVNEEWKVMEKINGEWVEAQDAIVKKQYIVYLGDSPITKYEISVTNIGEERILGFEQTIDMKHDSSTQSESNIEYGSIAMMILAVAIISIIAISARTRIVPRL